MRYWPYGYFLDQSPPTGSYWAGRYWSQGEYAGSIATTLDNFGGAFAGSIGSTERTGTVAVALEDATAAFAGAHLSLGNYWHENYWIGQYWQVNYWQDHEPSTGTGTIAVTLEAFATDFDGTSALVGGDRSGTIAVSLDGFTAAIAATYSAPVSIAGLIASTLDNATAAFLGGSVQIEYIDISVPIGIAWVITEYPAFNGTISVTLADYAAVATGTFLPAQAVSGFFNGRTDDFPTALAGTHVAPTGNVGAIVAATADATGLISGIVLEAGNFVGSMATSLEDSTSVFSAQHTPPLFTGSFAVTIDYVTSTIQAIFAEAGTKIGPLSATLEDATAAMDGHVTGTVVSQPKRVIRAGHRRVVRVRRRA